MARTPSTMVPLGGTAASFDLPDPQGRRWSRDACRGEHGLLAMFLCNHCPFVKHVAEAIRLVAEEAAASGVGVVAINSNDFEAHPEDAPPMMRRFAEAWGWRFPYLVDESQQVAEAYGAACTPDFFLFDGAMRLVYRGQLDGSRPGNAVPADGRDLLAAVRALAHGTPIAATQSPSLGCNIKWRPGRGPS